MFCCGVKRAVSVSEMQWSRSTAEILKVYNRGPQHCTSGHWLSLPVFVCWCSCCSSLLLQEVLCVSLQLYQLDQTIMSGISGTMWTDAVQDVYQDFLCHVTLLSGCTCDPTDPDNQVTVSWCVGGTSCLPLSCVWLLFLLYSELWAAPGSVSGSGVRPGETAGVCPQQSLRELLRLLCSEGVWLSQVLQLQAEELWADLLCLSAGEDVHVHHGPSSDPGWAASPPDATAGVDPGGAGSDRAAAPQSDRELRNIQPVQSDCCGATLLDSAAHTESCRRSEQLQDRPAPVRSQFTAALKHTVHTAGSVLRSGTWTQCPCCLQVPGLSLCVVFRFVKSDECRLVLQRFRQIVGLLQDFRDRVKSCWSCQLDSDCGLMLDQPLIQQNQKGVLEVKCSHEVSQRRH